MKNKYKLPSYVYKEVCSYLAGYKGRSDRLAFVDKDNMNNVDIADLKKNEAIDKAKKEIGVFVQSPKLKEELQQAIIENCCNKNASYEYFNLPGISKYLFYQEKHKFLNNIAKDCNLIN